MTINYEPMIQYEQGPSGVTARLELRAFEGFGLLCLARPEHSFDMARHQGSCVINVTARGATEVDACRTVRRMLDGVCNALTTRRSWWQRWRP